MLLEGREGGGKVDCQVGPEEVKVLIGAVIKDRSEKKGHYLTAIGQH